ncbi:MAG: acyl-CoA dehydrogenase family protein [Actinomycetota bacterium]
MDLGDTPEEAALRAEARAWLEAHFPAWRRSVGEPERYTSEHRRAWHRVEFEGGWGAPSWPVEYGGRGFGPVEYSIWSEEKARIGAAIPFNVAGFGMAGPTIIAHGSEEQKKRYVHPLLAGDEIWCQLFSEPGAGSDLAALTTRATRDGDSWIVTGQKVWSSQAHESDFGILLARYDFDKPKHEGLIYFIVDLRSPGIEVRPLRQISGDAEFNEVFMSDVRIPDENRIGEPGDGWRVAMTTLMFERMSIGSATGGFTFPFERLVEIARAHGRPGVLARQRLADVYTRTKILELLNARVLSKLRKGEIPTAEGSILKIALADLCSASAELGVTLLGGEGLVMSEGGPQRELLNAPAFHIGGGTDEVQRNLVAERVLGLPRDERPDKVGPFSKTVHG